MADQAFIGKEPGPIYRWYVLLLLFAIYSMNIADRQILGILAEDIKRDLALSDSEIGLLAGPVISFFYAILGVPMAYAADRLNRVRFVTVCLMLWSVFTMLGGVAQNLWHLAATRLGVSVAEAGGTPTSSSLIADYFPQGNRATAMAIYSSGATAGIFIAYALGGFVSSTYGWRNAVFLAGVPGILLAMLMILTVREPVRGAADEKAEADPAQARLSMWRTVVFVWRIHEIRRGIIASIFCNIGVFSILTWAPPFAVRTYDVGIAKVGAIMGSGIAIVGGAAMIFAGIAADWVARKSLAAAMGAMAAALSLSAVLIGVALYGGHFEIFAAAITLGYALLIAYSPLMWLILHKYSPASMRATSASVMLLAINLFSAVPAPLLIGVTSDLARPYFGDRSLQVALGIAPAAVLTAAFLFWTLIAMVKRGPR